MGVGRIVSCCRGPELRWYNSGLRHRGRDRREVCRGIQRRRRIFVGVSNCLCFGKDEIRYAICSLLLAQSSVKDPFPG